MEILTIWTVLVGVVSRSYLDPTLGVRVHRFKQTTQPWRQLRIRYWKLGHIDTSWYVDIVPIEISTGHFPVTMCAPLELSASDPKMDWL